INLLNERLANKFIQFLYNRNSVNELKLYPIQIPCDEQLIKYSKSKNATQSFTNEAELLEFIQMQFSNKMTIANILNKLNDIQLIAMTENKMIDKYSLIKQLDTIITYKNQNYWITEGKWLLITNEYNERVNETFLKRIGQDYNPSFSLNSMKPWLQGTEGEYNFSHNKLNNVYVMDKILIH